MEFTSIVLNKICKIEKKNVSRHKSVGFPAIFKKILGMSCGYEWLETSCRGQEMLVYRV